MDPKLHFPAISQLFVLLILLIYHLLLLLQRFGSSWTPKQRFPQGFMFDLSGRPGSSCNGGKVKHWPPGLVMVKRDPCKYAQLLLTSFSMVGLEPHKNGRCMVQVSWHALCSA